jgi:hypothetical protein
MSYWNIARWRKAGSAMGKYVQSMVIVQAKPFEATSVPYCWFLSVITLTSMGRR